jgi:hypothetical protein
VNRHSIASSIPGLLALLSLTSCGAFADDEETAINKVDDLVGCIERVHVETEVAKDVVRESVASLEALAAHNFNGDVATAYTDFMAAIKRSERQSERLRSTVMPMKEASEPVFQQWANDLSGFSSPRMRHLSEQRLATTRERYNAIVAAIDPAQSAFEVFTRGMRDIALFLGHDFNPVAVSEIEQDIHALANLASELDGRFDTCLMVARTYLDTSAMPSTPAAPGAAPPQGPPTPGRD